MVGSNSTYYGKPKSTRLFIGKYWSYRKMPGDRKQAVLAVDIGGTKTIVAVVEASGKIISRKYYMTLADTGPRVVIRRLSSAINKSIDQARSQNTQLIGIGLGVAGVVNSKKGIISTSPNLPGWRNVLIQSSIAEISGLDTYLINDANAAALGEHWFGAGSGFDNMLYITVSTGIGGGIIINNKLYSGTDGCAGEWGHMTVVPEGPKCHCGNFGCLESLASGWAIAREAVERVNRGESSFMTELVEGQIENISAEIVSSAARNGDRLACEIVARAANYLGIGLANLVNIFNPAVIVVGGGLSKMGDMMLKPARQVVHQRAFRMPAKTVRIVRARLGANAGIVGASAYVFEQRKGIGVKV
jgi:glucokinase